MGLVERQLPKSILIGEIAVIAAKKKLYNRNH